MNINDENFFRKPTVKTFSIGKKFCLDNTFTEFSPVSLKKIELIYHEAYSLLFSGKSHQDPWIAFSNI